MLSSWFLAGWAMLNNTYGMSAMDKIRSSALLSCMCPHTTHQIYRFLLTHPRAGKRGSRKRFPRPSASCPISDTASAD